MKDDTRQYRIVLWNQETGEVTTTHAIGGKSNVICSAAEMLRTLPGYFLIHIIDVVKLEEQTEDEEE